MCEFARTLLRNYEDFVSRYPTTTILLEVGKERERKTDRQKD